jgi:hypothetical protein
MTEPVWTHWAAYLLTQMDRHAALAMTEVKVPAMTEVIPLAMTVCLLNSPNP